MKNLSNIFESVNKVMNDNKAARADWHKQERTLARLLRIAQEKAMMPYTKPLFEAVGLPTVTNKKGVGTLTQKVFLAKYCKHFVEVKGEKVPAYVNRVALYERDAEGKVIKDADGSRKPLLDEKGQQAYTYKLTAIKAGTWTLERLLKACI